MKAERDGSFNFQVPKGPFTQNMKEKKRYANKWSTHTNSKICNRLW